MRTNDRGSLPQNALSFVSDINEPAPAPLFLTDAICCRMKISAALAAIGCEKKDPCPYSHPNPISGFYCRTISMPPTMRFSFILRASLIINSTMSDAPGRSAIPGPCAGGDD